MSRATANFVVFLLASAGVFIALVTGIAHASGVELPCGGTSGCDIIGRPENSRWLGVPIAFYGLALYMFVAFLAMFRAVMGLENSPKLGAAMWALLAAGSLVSVGLIAHAALNIHATCYWCVASAVTMVLAFLVHTYSSTKVQEGGKSPAFGAFMAGLSVAAIAGSVYGFSLRAEAPQATTVEASKPAFDDTDVFMGNKDASVVITEFTDLYCPTCRSQHAWLLSQIGDEIEAGKVKLVVRHYPLPNLHPLAIQAALFAVWAQEKGKFWEFFDAAHQIDDKEDIELLYKAVEVAGLNPDEAKALLTDKALRTPYANAMQKDIDEGTALGVEATPSWFVDYPDGKREFAVGSGIQPLVGNTLFQSAIR